MCAVEDSKVVVLKKNLFVFYAVAKSKLSFNIISRSHSLGANDMLVIVMLYRWLNLSNK